MGYKTMTVKRLIEELQKLADEHGEDLPVYLLEGPLVDDELAVYEAIPGIRQSWPKRVLLD